ncbi:sensor histidine kinase [Cystobacter ferrugineus]|uniref:histidine kinase n=1 Tax=Cystobacter ferrugineus TaxID=83449 RepID=A0A1L9B701_9BACT|nr:PAS domain-containing protein [Cystobacter ferrugineus]OJH38021.1 hypothetical protein BON30_22900 [Cystobacter ferrugineus]
MERARGQRLAPGGVSRSELEDPLPSVLRQLRMAPCGGASKDEPSAGMGMGAAGREHGAQRFRLGFTPGELVREYGLLSDLLLELLVDHGLQLPPEEVRLLTSLVATATAEAVEEHARQQARARREEWEDQGPRPRQLPGEGERARLNALFLQAPVGIGIIRGPQAVIDLANPQLCRLCGRRPDQVVGKPLLEALPELEGQGLDDLMREVMATGVAFVAKEQAIRFARGADGALETAYFNFVYDALRDEQGHVEGVIIVATEVTQAVLARQQVETLLQRTQESEQARAAMMDALAAQTLVAVCYLRGPDHVFETANPVYRQFVGRDVVGMKALEALPELASQGFPSNLTRVFQTGVPYMVRAVPVRVAQGRDGPLNERLFDLIYQPVRSPKGGIDGVLSLVFEVTEQVRLRQEAQRMAEEERSRRDFEQHLIGIVSHDLRTPLNAILLGVRQLLRREDLDASFVKCLKRLHSSTERAVRMVRDLLDFTQARLGGRLKIERAPMNVHEVVRAAVEELQATHPERELRLETRGNGQGKWDGDRLAQLVGNALKYSPANSVVTVRSQGWPEDVRLEVHNLGEPIAEEALPRLFQPLQRAVEGTDKTSRNVGLGLYIVDQIVRAHAGRIQVSSTAREGTLFAVRLPREG